ncbi:CmpA/NrtA family ABC transporter substrate-binding protein [Polynucleobacter sp. AP-Nickl1-40-C4]|uniref:CmpA/NrtA family ABC transporter substrate-binding protein n=1 Tax=Polynucleobacter sp. AP-Nickl1-40-C4 TaxID=3108275 RepID=UPI002B23997C|nr:CmpA/NrtA family ABC transporter substrate-binding protein [Polynucleobacter sp. AP-Nickl1-40-C4]MEA9567551.1 CmpA/NrtA family ABC transporter substrate-binding protein [Polynucleobacter sp. AP-Nickl1-40-C4]
MKEKTSISGLLPEATTPTVADANPTRRKLIQSIGSASILSLIDPMVKAGAWAAGSDAPEKTDVKVSFIALTDCSSVVMANHLGLDKKYGVKIIPTKEASWAAIRDKLVNGENDMSHILYGLVYGLQMGIGGQQKDMSVLMSINNNGQAISLSKALYKKGVTDGASLKILMDKEKRDYTFAQTFPTGTHAMWLYYWLANYGINPFKDAKITTVPPPQMVANMRSGNMDGFCVGEPWNARAIIDDVGFTAITTQAIWQDHPEKVLGSTGDFAKRYPNTCRAVVSAMLEASKYIDASTSNKHTTAEVVSAPSFINTDINVIQDRMMGRYNNGIGKTWDDPHAMKFYNDGMANYPYLSDGMWFMTQHKRWGLLKEHPDYLAVAKKVNNIALYKEAATATKTPLPKGDMRSSKLFDGIVWNGSNPAAYADSFKIKA